MDDLNKICELLCEIYKRGHIVYTCGNGGSSSTASHFTADLLKGCSLYNRGGIKSICLTDSSAALTCFSNDYSYEDGIKLYLQTMAEKGDCLVVFSGSGESENVIRAAEFAKNAHILVVGFLGRAGGKLKNYCDVCVLAPSDDMEEIENYHLMYVHWLKKELIRQLRNTFGMEIIRYPSNNVLSHAIFDFDGTISLIRRGWQKVMIPYFAEILTNTPKGQLMGQQEINEIVKTFVDTLTGKKTLFQCMELNDWVVKFGGEATDPYLYKKEYLVRLACLINDRRKKLAENQVDKDTWMVPGVKGLLTALRERGIAIYCASGTDEEDVRYEARLLGIEYLFDGNIYGARDDQGLADTKELVIQRIIEDNSISGDNIVVFGDGMVEIELCKKIGGYAVAVASEERCCAMIDEWKRTRLIKRGADLVIPNYGENGIPIINFLIEK